MSNLINEPIILNPKYKFKDDLDRICMYSVHNPNYTEGQDWISFIHPYQAVLLSVFSEVSPLEKNLTIIAKKFNTTVNKAFEIIKPYVENPTPVYTELEGNTVRFPKNVLIHAKDINSQDISPITIPDVTYNSVNLTDDRMHRAPNSLLWMLTSQCITNCAYCYADKTTHYTPMSKEIAFDIVNQAYDLGINYIDVIGGEIFAHPYWDELISKIISYGMSPSYISTKIPVTNNIIRKLEKSNYSNVIQFSLDSLSPDIINKTLRPSSTSYAKAMKDGILMLDKAGYMTQINTILTSDTSTIDNINELAVFIAKITNLKYWEIRIPDAPMHNARVSFNRIKATRSQLEKIIDYIKNNIMKSFHGRIILSHEALDETFHSTSPDEPCFKTGLCGMLTNRMFVLPDGKVVPCEEFYWHPDFIIGDLTLQNIESVWQSEKAIKLFKMGQDMYRDQSPCKRCSFFEDCSTKKEDVILKS